MDNYGADGSGDGNNSHRGAGRGRGRGSWAAGRPEPHSLRRPHSAAPAPATGFVTILFILFIVFSPYRNCRS